MNQIRPLAICLFRNQDRILVAEGYDPIKGETFYRPLGGGIEFGERSEETICRELMEEIGVEVKPGSLKYLGALENIFIFNGIPGHEIVLVYDGELSSPALYKQVAIVGKEMDIEEAFTAVWKNLNDSARGSPSCILMACWKCLNNGIFCCIVMTSFIAYNSIRREA